MGEGVKIIAQNRKARHDYSVDETYECGMELLGTEVKSFRDGKISFPDASYTPLQIAPVSFNVKQTLGSPERSLRGRQTATSTESQRASLPPDLSSPIVTFRIAVASTAAIEQAVKE